MPDKDEGLLLTDVEREAATGSKEPCRSIIEEDKLLEAQLAKARPIIEKQLLKEIASDMKLRFKALKITHGVSYVPLSAIEHYIMRLEWGTWQALKGKK